MAINKGIRSKEMKNIIITTGLILLICAVGFGQKQKQVSTSGSGSASSNSSIASGKGIMLDSGTAISGELQNTLDVKKARVGDPVILKTTKAVKQNGQTIVPKGTQLLGRVTEVAQKTKSNGGSRLGMVFDRIEGKNLSAPISASITSITNAAANSSLGDTGGADLFGSSNTSASASSGSSGGGGLLGGGSGGGLLGGATSTVNSTTGGLMNTTGGVLNSTTQTVGGVTNTAGQALGNTTGSVFRTVDGIQISNSVGGSVQAGTTLSAAGKNIRLDKGTSFQLQLNNSTRDQ